jgi:hypothetical protein
MSRTWRARVTATLFLLGCSTSAATAGKPATVWFYLNSHENWCALADHQRFLRAVAADVWFEEDRGSVSYVGGTATRIEEYQSNAEGEGSIVATYALNPAGDVTSVKLVDTDSHENQPRVVKTFWYKVVHGTYQPQSKEGATEARTISAFRRLPKLSSFPVYPVLARARASPEHGPFCTKTQAKRRTPES